MGDKSFSGEIALGSTPEVCGELMPGVERRRRWSAEDKLRILAQSVSAGSSATLTCKMHSISSGQLYTWRKQFRLGELTGFTPVSIVPEVPALSASTDEPGRPLSASAIEVELPNGIKLRVTGGVDAGVLRQVFLALR